MLLNPVSTLCWCLLSCCCYSVIAQHATWLYRRSSPTFVSSVYTMGLLSTVTTSAYNIPDNIATRDFNIPSSEVFQSSTSWAIHESRYNLSTSPGTGGRPRRSCLVIINFLLLIGGIEVNPGPCTTNHNTNELVFRLFNVRSAVNKNALIHDVIFHNNLSCLALTET